MLPFLLFLQLVILLPCVADDETLAIRKAETLGMAQDPAWLALLHYARGRCFVDDPSYYLSPSNCSPPEELSSLIKALFSSDLNLRRDVACRFPARIAFIENRLASQGIAIPISSCLDIKEYRDRAPADEISLIFAAENITHPISMMGHVFLKFSGTSASGSQVEHAASFFTRISSLNVAAIALDGLFLGMPALFALVPYHEQIHGYQTLEGRNIFEYPLLTSDLQKRLIQLHVWELRTIKSPYLFVGYNCATVVYFIIALAHPALLADLGLWISPIDVVRKAKAAGVISSRHFIPSIDWQTRFFGQQVGPDKARYIIDTLRTGATGEINSLFGAQSEPLERGFAEAFVQREKQSPRLLAGRLDEIFDLLQQSETNEATELEVSNLKDPTSGPRSRSISLGTVSFAGASYAKLSVLPASHSLSDDNRRSYSESSLELGSASLLVNPNEEREIVVEKINIYGMESLVPFDPYIGGTSSRLLMGVQQEWDGELSPYTAGHLTLGLGKTLELTNDWLIYGLVNGAASYGDSRLNLSYFPEIGTTLYEILSMKTVANYRLVCGQHGAKSCYQSVSAIQSFIPNDSLSPYVSFSNLWSDDKASQIFEIGLKIYF